MLVKFISIGHVKFYHALAFMEDVRLVRGMVYCSTIYMQRQEAAGGRSAFDREIKNHIEKLSQDSISADIVSLKTLL
jgi:hypothetical protein